MKVSELAKELNTKSDVILATLKSLKLKAKDSKQELSSMAVSVVKREFAKTGKPSDTGKAATPIPTKVPKAKPESKTKEPKAKKATVKKKTVKTKTVAKKTKVTTKDSPKPKFPTKPKGRINKGPVITLKPLARKKRKAPSHAGPRPPGTDAFQAEKHDEASAQQASDEIVPEAIQEQRAHDDSLVDIEIDVPITVKDLSIKLQQKPSVVLKQLMKTGILVHINQTLNEDIIRKIARDFGFNLAKIKTQEEEIVEHHKQEEEDPKLLKSRAPVITFMGHVDHGKTSLLDKIRKSKVADDEHGGITQHIGAYSVEMPKGRITFLDTPGHEAFTAMRARGAHITDLIVLVVAADEGIMPQTEEAIDHARAAGVPIVVALNKIDRKNADPDRVKKQLGEKDLTSEDWGGKTVVSEVSAETGEGVDHLLEMILLESEMLELKANAKKKALGIVVEAHLSQGKGVMVTLIVQSGTLKEGDFIVAGAFYGKVKAMLDDHHRPIKEAGPSMPVEILGLSDVPDAGELFYVVEDEKQAREISLQRHEQIKNKKLGASQKITLEDLYSQIQEGTIKELNVILKADVQGSAEALRDSLEKIPSDKVKINIIHSGVGDVNASDVLLAIASKAVVIAFHVSVGPRAKVELEKEYVDIRHYRIIYDAVNDMKKALEGMLEAKTRKKFLSRIEIRQIFKLSTHGKVAGCLVTKGTVHRKDKADVIRNDEIVYSGSIASLKRFKDDVKEVAEGTECGINFDGFEDFQEGDIIEVYEVEKIAQKL